MSANGEFWKKVKQISKSVNTPPVQVGWIKSLEPFVVQYQGLELSKENGDTIYINHLMLDANIELDLASMDEAQTINPALWKADNTPTPTVEISGTQKPLCQRRETYPPYSELLKHVKHARFFQITD